MPNTDSTKVQKSLMKFYMYQPGGCTKVVLGEYSGKKFPPLLQLGSTIFQGWTLYFISQKLPFKLINGCTHNHPILFFFFGVTYGVYSTKMFFILVKSNIKTTIQKRARYCSLLICLTSHFTSHRLASKFIILRILCKVTFQWYMVAKDVRPLFKSQQSYH